jgi:hypothetical protein
VLADKILLMIVIPWRGREIRFDYRVISIAATGEEDATFVDLLQFGCQVTPRIRYDDIALMAF